MAGHPETDLGVYVLGVLPGAESTRLRLHLETCPSCRARVDELEGISELLSAARLVADPPPGLVEESLASLPARRAPVVSPLTAPPDGRDGDFVVVAAEGPRRRPHRAKMAVAGVGVAVISCAALAWVLAPEGQDAIELAPQDPTSQATLTVESDGTGIDLTLHATGLAAGDYTVEVGDHPAGSFRAVGGDADVELHTAATAGHLVVRRDSDGTVVLEGDLP